MSSIIITVDEVLSSRLEFCLAMAEVENSLPAAAAISGTVSQQPGADKDALITRLDTLLEQYLHNLDQYEKLTQQLSKQLSSVCKLTLQRSLRI